METFTNAYGGTVEAPVIVASSAATTTYDAVTDPTLMTWGPSVPAAQNGLTLTVTKVKLAAHATRVFVQATNNSGGPVTIADVEATLTQGSSQLNTNAGSPDTQFFPTPVANGVTTTDELVFAPASPNGGPLTLTLTVIGENFNQTWNPFALVINP